MTNSKYTHNSALKSTSSYIKVQCTKAQMLTHWKTDSFSVGRTYYYYSFTHRYGRYTYYIQCNNDVYHLGLVAYNDAEKFPIAKTKHDSLDAAKIAAEEHYLLYFANAETLAK